MYVSLFSWAKRQRLRVQYGRYARAPASICSLSDCIWSRTRWSLSEADPDTVFSFLMTLSCSLSTARQASISPSGYRTRFNCRGYLLGGGGATAVQHALKRQERYAHTLAGGSSTLSWGTAAMLSLNKSALRAMGRCVKLGAPVSLKTLGVAGPSATTTEGAVAHVTQKQIVAVLDSNKYSYNVGHASFVLQCPFCGGSQRSGGRSMFLNKTTGGVVCKPCDVRGGLT